MKPEKKMWLQLSAIMAGHWDASRHEGIPTGCPDVSFGACGVNGWIELKTIEKWPARPQTVVDIPHYTPEQRLWIYKRAKVGGPVWLLLKIGHEWLLFNAYAAQRVGKVNQVELRRIADEIFTHTSKIRPDFFAATLALK